MKPRDLPAVRFAGADNRDDLSDHSRIARSPLVGLHCSHRGAHYGMKLGDAEAFDERLLYVDKVLDGDYRERYSIALVKCGVD